MLLGSCFQASFTVEGAEKTRYRRRQRRRGGKAGISKMVACETHAVCGGRQSSTDRQGIGGGRAAQKTAGGRAEQEVQGGTRC